MKPIGACIFVVCFLMIFASLVEVSVVPYQWLGRSPSYHEVLTPVQLPRRLRSHHQHIQAAAATTTPQTSLAMDQEEKKQGQSIRDQLKGHSLPDGGEIVGSINSSSSEFNATNNRAPIVRQYESGSTASERKSTRETPDRKGITFSLEDLRQYFFCKLIDVVSVCILLSIYRLCSKVSQPVRYSPRTLEKPNEPQKPKAPEKPKEPEKPKAPEKPKEPEKPKTPEKPRPKEPEKQKAPEEPKPKEPEKPKAPEEPKPKEPEKPKEPKRDQTEKSHPYPCYSPPYPYPCYRPPYPYPCYSPPYPCYIPPYENIRIPPVPAPPPKAPEKGKGRVTSENLQQYYGHKRADVAASLGVSVSTFKRMCRQQGITRWQNRMGSSGSVSKPPDQDGESNTSTACEMPSHNVQTGMEGELFGENEVANVLRRDFMGGPNALDIESGLIMVSRPPDQHGERNTSTACETPSHNVENEMGCQNSKPNEFQPDSFEDLNLEEFLSDCDFLPLGEEPSLEGLVSGSVNSTLAACFDPATCQHPMPTNPDTMTTTHKMPCLAAEGDMRFVTLKLTYRKKIIKFQFPLMSGIIELKEEVKKRLNLELDRFDIEYKDGDECIFLGCDEDLRNHLHLQLLSNEVIWLLVVDSDANTTNFR